MEYESFIILVSDRDATVGMISAMLLSSALATERSELDARVRVLIKPEIIKGLEAPELPEEIRKIEEAVISASISDIENANLIVAFSGIDLVELDEIREIGVAAPAVNLCQFADNLEALAIHSLAAPNDVRDVVVGSALQFELSGGSSSCSLCEALERENIYYWLNIADTCSRFAQTLQKMQSEGRN